MSYGGVGPDTGSQDPWLLCDADPQPQAPRSRDTASAMGTLTGECLGGLGLRPARSEQGSDHTAAPPGMSHHCLYSQGSRNSEWQGHTRSHSRLMVGLKGKPRAPNSVVAIYTLHSHGGGHSLESSSFSQDTCRVTDWAGTRSPTTGSLHTTAAARHAPAPPLPPARTPGPRGPQLECQGLWGAPSAGLTDTSPRGWSERPCLSVLEL